MNRSVALQAAHADHGDRSKDASVTRLSRIKRLLAPVFKANPDTAHANGWLVLTPLRHVFRGVVISMTSSKGIFRTCWGTGFMYSHSPAPGISADVFASGYEYGKAIDFLQEKQQSELLCRAVEEITFPFLRPLGELEQYYLYSMHKEQAIWYNPISHFRLELAMGHHDLARAIYREHHDGWRATAKGPNDLDPEFWERLFRLCRYFEEGDFASIGQLLRDSEAATARNFKMDHLWEPSPFPFEPGYAEWREQWRQSLA